MKENENGGARKEKQRLPLWVNIIGALATVFCLGMAAFIAGVFAAMTGSQFFTGFYPVVVIGLMIFAVLLIFVRKRRWLWKALLVFVVIAALVGGAVGIYENYVNSLAVVRSGDVDIMRYQSYVYDIQTGKHTTINPELARLSEATTLRFSKGEGFLPRIDGATALLPVYSAFVVATYPVDGYSIKDYSSKVSCTTTSRAYQRLIDGSVDVIFVAAPSEKQLADAQEKGVELVFTPIGREAFVFFVNEKNNVDGLTTEQIRGIYSGEITNWKQLGGANRSIRAFQRDEGSGSQSALIRLMDGAPLIDAPIDDRIDFMGGIVNKTADYKNFGNAIGFSFRFYVTEMLGDDQIKLLEIDGVYPSEQAIRDGSYPLSNTFFAVTRIDPNENVTALVDWVVSAQGQELVEKTGYVGIN